LGFAWLFQDPEVRIEDSTIKSAPAARYPWDRFFSSCLRGAAIIKWKFGACAAHSCCLNHNEPCGSSGKNEQSGVARTKIINLPKLEMIMKKNVGSLDRGIRLLLGLLIIGFGVFYQSWWGIVGVVPLLTAGIGWCPPYALLGFSTCRVEQK
jgi:Inner membrane protein YgaP-like, transmembrane domain